MNKTPSKKVYKYSRKEIVEMWLGKYNPQGDWGQNLKDDLLATEESKPKVEIIKNHKTGEVWVNGEPIVTPPQPKKIEKVEDGCKEVETWIKQLWKKQCEIIDRLNSLTNK